MKDLFSSTSTLKGSALGLLRDRKGKASGCAGVHHSKLADGISLEQDLGQFVTSCRFLVVGYRLGYVLRQVRNRNNRLEGV